MFDGEKHLSGLTILKSNLNAKEIIEHLRKFVKVKKEDGSEIVFAFARHFNLYPWLYYSNAEEQSMFFQPFSQMILADTNKNIIHEISKNKENFIDNVNMDDKLLIREHVLDSIDNHNKGDN